MVCPLALRGAVSRSFLTGMAENIPRATPGRLLLLFSLLFLAVAAATWRDAPRRESLDSVDFPTAMGDEELCPPEALTIAGGFAARLFGEEKDAIWSPTGPEAIEWPEDRLYKVGRDLGDRFYIYQPARGPKADSHFVKMGDRSFRELKR